MDVAAQNSLERYLKLLQLDENNVNLLIDIFYCYKELDDLTLAKQYLDRASRINPEACLMLQGILHIELDALEQAKTFFKAALTSKDDPLIHYHLALCCYLEKDFVEAHAILKPLLRGEFFAEIFLLASKIAYYQENMAEALALLNIILSHNPYHVEALSLLGQLYFSMSNYEAAENMALQALQLDSNSHDARLIETLVRFARQEAHSEEIEALLHEDPKDVRLWFALGSMHIQDAFFDKAQDAIKKALEIQPEFYDAWITLAWCQLFLSQTEEAFESYTQATDLAEHYPEGWAGLAIVHALQDNFSKALFYINKAFALAEDCFLTEVARALFYNQNAEENNVLVQGQRNQKLQQALLALKGNATLH